MADRPLDESGVDADPLCQFERWLAEAAEAGTFEPEAMALATATPAGAPSARMVLLKGFDRHGFRFFSAQESRKGRELEANPAAALLFHWPQLGRQVRIEGPVSRVPRAETEAYVRSRSRASQLSALASHQSEPVESRSELERRVRELDERHAGAELPVPEHWGGFRLEPELYELWQHREHRLHDRLRYRRSATGWELERLQP